MKEVSISDFDSALSDPIEEGIEEILDEGI